MNKQEIQEFVRAEIRAENARIERRNAYAKLSPEDYMDIVVFQITDEHGERLWLKDENGSMRHNPKCWPKDEDGNFTQRNGKAYLRGVEY